MLVRLCSESIPNHVAISPSFSITFFLAANSFVLLLTRRDWRNSYAGETNAKGEEQKKLDVLSNELFVKALISSGRRCLLVSEEVEEAIFVPSSHRGKYIVVFDPWMDPQTLTAGFLLELSLNEAEVSLEDALQPGNQMLAAGYCMYGSSCTFVLSKGNGVKFILTHPNIKIPSKGKIYSVNEGNVFILTLMSNAVWLLISIELCFMVASSCTLLIKQEVRLSQEKIHEGLPVFLGSYDDMEQMKELYAASKEDDY
ncbi:Fructose-1,6-bisphosphatase, cytosolic [Glycine max]|nr:Fructose-1,6-bisphosphatase, cytosolic [Glycine max]